LKKRKVRVVYTLRDGSVKVDEFVGRKVTAQSFKNGRGLVHIDNDTKALYRRAEMIVHYRKKGKK
jgi:hypothetical protein